MAERNEQHAPGMAELYREEMAQVQGGDNSHGTHVAGTIGAVGNNSVAVAETETSITMIPIKVKHNV